MAPLPPIAQVLRIRTSGTYFTSPWMNHFFVKYTGTTPQETDLANYCQQLVASWSASLASACSLQVRLTQVDATDLSSSTGAFGLVPADVPGVRAGGDLTVNDACVISWKVNRRWRGGHPRTYLPAGVQTDIQNGRTWNSGFLTAIGTAAANWRSELNSEPIGTATGRMVSVRYIDNKVALANPYVDDVVSSAVHPRVDSQRRRSGAETL